MTHATGPARDPEIPDLLSKAEAARKLQCSHQYVQTLIMSGRLPAAMVGAYWVIRAAAVEAFSAHTT